jgi:hypothetical protein
VKATLALVLAVLLVTAACSSKSGGGYTAPAAPNPTSGAAPWPAPRNPLVLAKRAGVELQLKESFTFHIHAHLDIYVNGRPVTVPAGLGIDIHDPGVKHGKVPGDGESYGGISLCRHPCISPLHTHQADGIVHVESPAKQDYRLGRFFTEWNVRLDASCIGGYCEPDAKFAAFVNGKRRTGNPAEILFSDHEEIAIVIGSPPAEIPVSYTTPEA